MTHHNVAFASHQRLFHSDLTVQEHLRLVAASYGQLRQAVDGLLDQSDLPPAERISRLSRAQRRRLSLESALLAEPVVLMLDDLTRGLTPGAARQLWQMVQQAREKRPFTIRHGKNGRYHRLFWP